MDIPNDTAMIRSNDNPIAFQVSAKDLGYIPKYRPSTPPLLEEEEIKTLPQHSDTIQSEESEESEMAGGDKIPSDGEIKPMRIVIKDDFNKGLNLLASHENDEDNSGDEDDQTNIKKVNTI